VTDLSATIEITFQSPTAAIAFQSRHAVRVELICGIWLLVDQ